jgi:ATP-dependent DNA ligase
MRLIALVENGGVEYLSRSGKPATQWDGLFDDELVKLEKQVGCPIVVDGEALSIEGFAATAKAKGSKNDKSSMRYFTFDYMTLDQWKAQTCPVDQEERSDTLAAMIKLLNLTKIIKSTSRLLKNMDEAKAFYTEVIELGLPGQDEGLIIKDLHGKYEWNSKKRTLTWAKWKPVIDIDVKIVDAYEGKEGTKNEGRLGGFIVEGEDENGNKIRSRCGGFKVNSKKFKDWIVVLAKANAIKLEEIYDSGISKDEFFRTYAWNNLDKFIGQTCMIETQELSKAEGSETFALRFPQFICCRYDK